MNEDAKREFIKKLGLNEAEIRSMDEMEARITEKAKLLVHVWNMLADMEEAGNITAMAALGKLQAIQVSALSDMELRMMVSQLTKVLADHVRNYRSAKNFDPVRAAGEFLK